MHKIEEKIVIYNGELKYAVALYKKDNQRTYLTIRNGVVYFENSWYGGTAEYDGSEETHAIAKSIFMNELQCAVRKRVSELKLLESVLNDVGVGDVLGDVIFTSTQLLIEQKVQEVKDEVKDEVKQEIIKTVKPRALKKKKVEA